MNIDQSILQIIEKGNVEENLYFLPKIQLDRKTYLSVNKVLECLGGKWNRKARAHVFESDISDAIDDVLLTGEAIDKKKEFQFFETPQNIVNKLIKLAEIYPGHKCLEPSAGSGNIAEALRIGAGNGMVTCVELNSACAQVLTDKFFHVHEGDFLQTAIGNDYDRVVMNPPFTRQQDIDHVLKAMTCLKGDGILVSVMSAGVMFRENKKTVSFWDKVHEHNFETVSLPSGSFKISGTMVNAIILKILRREESGEDSLY